MANGITSIVVATVAVEVEVGPWGEDSMVGDLFKAAEREAAEKVQVALQKSPFRVTGVTTSRVVSARAKAP